MEIINIIKERLSIFNNLYDSIRIINPIDKKVNGNDSSVRMEFNETKIFIIVTTSVSIENNIYIVEIIKNVSQLEGIKDNKKSICDIESLLQEMNDYASRDELTGMYNRRYINEKLPTDINSSITHNQPLCVVMVDLDFFKNVNDSYGHIAGDWVLKDFAKILSTSIRSDLDWVGRYGGEEFLIVIRNTDEKNAFNVIEKIRKSVENKIFAYQDIKIKITASFGAYSIMNSKILKDKMLIVDKKLIIDKKIIMNSNINIDEIINEADKNLYLAKRSGRNKTIINL